MAVATTFCRKIVIETKQEGKILFVALKAPKSFAGAEYPNQSYNGANETCALQSDTLKADWMLWSRITLRAWSLLHFRQLILEM